MRIVLVVIDEVFFNFKDDFVVCRLNRGFSVFYRLKF
jgi:hypothetical protein